MEELIAIRLEGDRPHQLRRAELGSESTNGGPQGKGWDWKGGRPIETSGKGANQVSVAFSMRSHQVHRSSDL